ncbi:antitoxin of toxin-antitoxin stability system [Bordetella genomosp. 5]|uniref:antitoxin of toxin-antitoxin stability system n=1 Tax=Bordetella genomosp. 5 TaxID=1395608 RepID=UPI001C3CC076|nr:antitoxin of toxin-antitoxin stability system [Bordetella genomosp. 5]
MSTKAVFTMKLEPELRDMFMAEAAADDRPAAQVVRELMRDYISRRRQAREYDEFVQRKVDRARASMNAGVGLPQAEVEADAAARRAELLRRADEAGL